MPETAEVILFDDIPRPERRPVVATSSYLNRRLRSEAEALADYALRRVAEKV